jgi:hypothetical protein
VALSGVLLSVEAPDGVRWNSGWKPAGITLFPDQTSTQLSFTLKKKFFDRVKSEAVKARISFAFSVYRDQNRREFVIPNGEFLMSDVGFCSAEASYLREIHCRAPLRTPSSIMITSDLAATTCAPREGESRSVAGQIARDWNQNSDSGPAEFGISPVKSLNLFLWGHNASDRHTISGLCPGTPLIISSPVLVGASATELEFNGLRLGDYRLRQGISGATGSGFSIWR